MECYGIGYRQKWKMVIFDGKKHTSVKFGSRYEFYHLNKLWMIKIMRSNRNVERAPFMLSLLRSRLPKSDHHIHQLNQSSIDIARQ